MFKAKHSLTIAVGLCFLLQRSLIITPITKKIPTTIAGIFYYAKRLLKRHCMRTKRQGRLHGPCRCLFISKKQKRRKKRASRTLFRCSTRSDLAEMGECRSCTQQFLLPGGLYYSTKNYYVNGFPQQPLQEHTSSTPRCIYQLYRLTQKLFRIIWAGSATVLIIDGFDFGSAHHKQGLSH